MKASPSALDNKGAVEVEGKFQLEQTKLLTTTRDVTARVRQLPQIVER
jgi:hypothetical protein